MKKDILKEVVDLMRGLPELVETGRKDGINLHEAEFRCIIDNRINHCYADLMLHKDSAKVNFQSIACWETGHFSLPVFKMLVESRDIPLKEWNKLIWEQIIRQMALDECYNMELINIATEFLLCGE